MTAKPLTPNLTSYDFLKTAALLLMIVDHIGYYFYPDDMWWRAVGRMSAPIWLFLIGYAKSRDFSGRMWVAIAILTLCNWAVGQAILPLTILVTMLIARALIDPLMERLNRHREALWPISFMLFAGTLVTFMLFEYGSEAMLLVMFGYMVRNPDKFPMKRADLMFFGFAAMLAHFLVQILMFFQFTTPQTVLIGGGLIAVLLVLLRFQPAQYTATDRVPRPAVWLLQLCGRRSLELYVAHIVLFRFAAMQMGLIDAQYFDFHILQ